MRASTHGRFTTVRCLVAGLAWVCVLVGVLHAGARLGPVNITREAGSVLDIPIGCTSTEAVTCVQFDLLYDPARVTLGAINSGTNKSDHVVQTSDISAGRRRVVLFSSTLAPLDGGYLVRVPLTWATEGDSALGVDAVTLASPVPAAVAFNGSALTPSVSSDASAGGPIGGSVTTLNVEPTVGDGVTYQWRFNGQDIAGATAASLSLRSAQHFNAGTYTVVTTANGLVLGSESYTLNVQAPPPNNARLLNLSTRALAQTGDGILIPGFVLGGSGTKTLLIRGVGPTLGTFGVSGTLADPQMRLVDGGSATVASNDDWGTNANAADIASTAATVGAFALNAGSKDAALLIDLAPGSYTVPTAGAAGGTGIAIVELYDADTGTPATNLVNISNRGFVGIGDNVMIPGIVVSNEGPRTFLIRAVGPALGAAPFNVGGVLADPVLTVFHGSEAILTNDDWGANPDAALTASTAATVGAFALPGGSADAAFVVTLPPGGYTVQATGKNGATGVALVEVYLVP